jgi:hypothetical protein
LWSVSGYPEWSELLTVGKCYQTISREMLAGPRKYFEQCVKHNRGQKKGIGNDVMFAIEDTDHKSGFILNLRKCHTRDQVLE